MSNKIKPNEYNFNIGLLALGVMLGFLGSLWATSADRLFQTVFIQLGIIKFYDPFILIIVPLGIYITFKKLDIFSKKQK
ncbi:MAG: hypothetical protein V4686_01685 [Patescibacteria group bacterium]